MTNTHPPLTFPREEGILVSSPKSVLSVIMSCILEPVDLVKTPFQTLASVENQAIPFGKSYVALGDKSKQ